MPLRPGCRPQPTSLVRTTSPAVVIVSPRAARVVRASGARRGDQAGLDEHVWHHASAKPVDHGGRDPKELTGMVDLTRDEHGHLHAPL